MSQPPAAPSGSATPPDDRLDSWKEIASYLSRDVTTVQRWEKREGMPVHRHVHDKLGSVYAYRAELEAWARSRNLRVAPDNGPAVSPPSSSSQAAGESARWTVWTLAVLGISLAVAVTYWMSRREYFWRSPLEHARFQVVTDFGGTEQAAAVSPDGKFIAFLSDREGQMDVWLTQVGSGQFYNLTRGTVPELVNPSVRTLGFSPDSTLVTFWARKRDDSGKVDISTWAVPTLGGPARPYLEEAAEFDWTRDGSRVAYHTPGPGDPVFIVDASRRRPELPVFTAPAGLHCHFPLWSPDGKYLYFVLGALPDKLDIWRIPAAGGNTERITSHNAAVSHPVFIDDHTLVYLASDNERTGLVVHSVDVNRRVSHRLTVGPERYTSLGGSADGRRLVLTLASPKTSLWRLPVSETPAPISAASAISLTTSAGSSPRLGAGHLVYVSSTGSATSIWKLTHGASTELWRGEEAQVLGGPAIAGDGRIAFSVRQRGQTLLYVMAADGASAHVVSDSLQLQGAPAWSVDGKFILTAANDNGAPHLFRVPVEGGAPVSFVSEYAVDPALTPDGRLVLFSGADVGTTFPVKAVNASGQQQAVPSLPVSRGSRHIAFLGSAVVLLRGELQHKNVWMIDLRTGAERQLTDLPADFHIRDFDISPDGRELVLERVQDRSDIVMLDRAK